MKKTIFYESILVFLISAGLSAASQTQLVTVKGTRINMRAAPSPEAEVVGQVSEPEQLVLQGSVDEPWVKVTPPENVDLWVFAKLVDDNNKINAKSVRIRAGAGLNYNIVGELNTGDSVIVRGKMGDWLKIAPFPEASVWITNAYVKLASPKQVPLPKKSENNDREHTPAKVGHAAVAPQPPPFQEKPEKYHPITDRVSGESVNPNALIGPAAVPASKLRPGAKQALSGSYAGILALSPAGVHPTPFRLVLFDQNNNPVTVCYVLGNRQQLDTLKGQNFTIEGTVYWFKDTALPTIFAQNILRHRR
ncbi:MAG: SH3 domain-containing protein [Lentisphaerae bacterium]|nr:SH3 domain-containing protein [Lentisphaerota bacterium]